MTRKNEVMSPQLKALKKIDLSPMIRISNLMTPRLLGGFLTKLNEKQRIAIDKVLPAGKGKKFYIHLAGTPTPPIVMEFSQPLKMTPLSEDEVNKQRIKGIRLNIEDLQVLSERKITKILWRLRGQLGKIMGLSSSFLPLIFLGPRQLKDMQNKAMTHFKPLLDLMPR